MFVVVQDPTGDSLGIRLRPGRFRCGPLMVKTTSAPVLRGYAPLLYSQCGNAELGSVL